MATTTDEPITAEARQAVEDLLLPAESTIHERILAILAELPAIGKDQRNEQQHFMYRGHDDVMNALNPLLAKHGVYFTPKVIKRTTSERQTGRGSTMYEVNLCVLYTFYGASGDHIEAIAWGEGTDMGDKSTNKAMTMALKNVLAQVFAISTAELSDADAQSPEETTRNAATPTPTAGGRQSRKQAREFDPGRDLAPGAIDVRTEEDAVSIRQGLRDMDPNLPWVEIENYCALHVFEKPQEELTGAERKSYWKRLANAIIRANELAGGGGDFPPPTHDNIKQAFAWAFNGVVLALDETRE